MVDLEALRKVSLFSKMDDEELLSLSKELRPVHFAPNQVIIREGEPGDSFHVVTSGNVAFLTVDAAGREIQLDTAGPGQWFGELSMLTGDPRSARVKALSDVTTLSLDINAFRDFVMRTPHAALDILAVIGKRLANAGVLLRRSAAPNVNELADEQITLWQKVADFIATMSSSATFSVVHLVWFGAWIVFNLFRGEKGFDPYPFGLLTMVVSLEAIFLSIFVLVSQGRSGEIDRLAADVDHQVNMKAEAQTQLILQRLDDLERGMHHLHAEHVTLTREIHGTVRSADN